MPIVNVVKVRILLMSLIMKTALHEKIIFLHCKSSCVILKKLHLFPPVDIVRAPYVSFVEA